MFAIDLHAHTRFFHGFPELGRRFDPVGARLLARVAAARGLDAVVTTNHDYYRAFDVGEGVALLPGIEVTTTRGHVLVVGPDPPRRTNPGALEPAEVVDLAHDRGCVAIVAHPFRNSTVREADAGFDAVELNGKGSETVQWVRDLAARLELPLVGGSDAHYPIEVGRAYTRVEVDDGPASGGELTPEALVDAIRNGRVEPCVDRSPGQQLLRAAYGAIHRRKGWLGPRGWEPPGLGSPPGEGGDGS